ncbi:MAG: hypothetical protein ACI8S6_005055 [Myxococcota bacterium]|jgi:hypothetical protein
MLRHATRGALVGLTGAMLASTRPALAEPGDHIGNDNVELIPSLALTTQQRSNVFLQEGAVGGGEETTPGTNLRIQPSLTLKAESADVLFGFSGGYTARKYFQSEITNLDRYRDFDLRGNLYLLRKLSDRFQINGFESEADKADNPYIQVLSNDLGGRLAVRPGTSLDLDLGGDLSITNYSGPGDVDSSFVRTGQNDRLGYGPAIDLKWRFLPKTAIVGSWSTEWFTWSNNVIEPTGTDAALGIPNGREMRFEGGLRGRFTEKLVLGLTAGYGTAIYDETSVTDAPGGDQATGDFTTDVKGLPGLILGADASYSLTESQTFAVGYRKDFQDVFFTNFVAYNRFSASYSGTFAARYRVELSGNYRYEDYDGVVDRNDHRIITSGGLTYIATKYLDVSLGGGWRRRASADRLNPDIEFDDLDVRLGVRFTY